MVAIVTDVHYRMSLALIRDLGQAGVDVTTCERESRSPAPGAVSRWSRRHVQLPDKDYTDALFRLCRDVGGQVRPALLPVGAATLAAVAEQPERFSQVCGLCIPSREQLDLLNSKTDLAALARQLDVPVPESYACQDGESIPQLAARLPLPCVMKPVCGEKLGLTAADRYVIARTPAEAERAYRHFQNLAGEPPVVQSYLPGDGLGCSVLAQDGQVLAAICHRRLREYPVSGGPSSCCRCVDRPDLLELASRLAGAVRLTGLTMFEFKEDAAGAPRLLEANPRIWGTFPLTRAARSQIPLLWCALAWNRGNPDDAVPLPELPRPLPKKMVFAVSDLMSAAGSLRRGRPAPAAQSLLDLLNPAVADGLFEWGDPRPGMAYIQTLFRKRLHK